MKKLVSVFLAIVISLSSAVFFNLFVFAEENFTVTFGGDDVDSPDSVKAVEWWKDGNGKYYFFIPSYWDAKSIKLWASSDHDVTINDVDLVNGQTYDLGESGTIVNLNDSYEYTVVKSGDVGSVFITTESGSLDNVHADKNYKEKGAIAIYNNKGKAQYEGGLDYIKGRGNASWQNEKKPYNIKLDSKTKLFGMAKSKKWCLIANNDDLSLMRNSIVFGAAADAGLQYTPEYSPIDLYINGEYKGAYIITSKIEADSNRIDVENLDDINEDACVEAYGKDFDMDTLERGGKYGKYAGLLEGSYKYVNVPEDKIATPTDGGYVLELELANRYYDEISGFVSDRGQPAIMKCPEYGSKSQMEYISDYFQRVEDAVYSDNGKNSKGESFSDLVNVESFAKYYDISEWCSNMDSGLTSTYFYLDNTKDGILYAGPVWDYDIALGNNNIIRFGCDYTNPEEFTVCFGRYYRNTVFGKYDIDEKPNLFNVLTDKPDFIAECKAYWDSDIYDAVCAWSGDKFDEYHNSIKNSAVMNHIRWNSFGSSSVSEVEKAYEKEVSGLKTFASKRTEFLNSNIGTVQVQNVKTNPVLKIFKKGLTGINNLFEKIIVFFHLENK